MEGIRRRIETARTYGGFSSQEKLAKAIGMTPGTFQRRLSGQYPWRRADLLAIAEVCEVPIWFLESGFEGATSRAEDEAEEVAWGLEAEGIRDDAEGRRGRA